MKSGNYVKVKSPKLPKINGQPAAEELIVETPEGKIALKFGSVYRLSARISEPVKETSGGDYSLMSLKFAKKHENKLEIIK